MSSFQESIEAVNAAVSRNQNINQRPAGAHFGSEKGSLSTKSGSCDPRTPNLPEKKLKKMSAPKKPSIGFYLGDEMPFIKADPKNLMKGLYYKPGNF